MPKSKKDGEKDFGKISEKAFEFWNNPADDVYEKFYKEKTIKSEGKSFKRR